MALTATIRLDLINSMLRTIGTSPLATSDTQHPDYITADAVLVEVIEDFSGKPLWFNTSTRVLYKDTEGKVAVPNDTISCDPIDQTKNLVVRDRYLFDIDKRTYVLDEDVECFIQSELELSDMPKEAIKYIRHEARLRFFSDEDGGAAKMQRYTQAAFKAEMELDVVNIARMDLNWFRSRGAQDFFTARSSSSRPLGGAFIA